MAKQLPLWGKIIYGTGAGGFNIIDRAVITWLFFFYTSPQDGRDALLTATVFGYIMFLGRAVDSLADPVISRYSDNMDSRRGRRLPFMIAGGILYVLVAIALFYPPGHFFPQMADNTFFNTSYLIVLMGGYFLLFTVYVCPYLALLPELARTNRDRVDLSTFKAIFTLIGIGAGLIGTGILIDMAGYHGMIWIIGGVGLVFLYLPVLIREKDYSEAKPATLGIFEALKTTFKNRAFSIYLAGNIAFWFGFNIITLSIPFYVTILMGLDEGAAALYFGVSFVVAAVFFPVVNYLAKKWGLKILMTISLALFVLLLPLLYFFGQSLFGIPANILGMILMGAAGIPLSILLIVPDAIVAATSDLEEQTTGQRREAMYFGAQGFIMKMAMGLSSLVLGLLLDNFGKTAAEPLGIQLTGPVAALFILAGLLIFINYPEKEVMSLRREELPPTRVPPLGQ